MAGNEAEYAKAALESAAVEPVRGGEHEVRMLEEIYQAALADVDRAFSDPSTPQPVRDEALAYKARAKQELITKIEDVVRCIKNEHLHPLEARLTALRLDAPHLSSH